MAPSPRSLVLFAVMAAALLASPKPAAAQTDDKPTFKSGVDMVTISAVVRDRKGRLVPNLSVTDFHLLDRGETKRIKEFRRDETPISLALLVDISGSMDVADNKAAARDAAHHIVSWLRPGMDEAALFSFDSGLEEVRPFTGDFEGIKAAFDTLRPFGVTRLRDAIAATSQRLVQRGALRRAVVVLTDGMDTASRLSAPQVASIASAIEVPVYIVAVVSPLNHPGADTAVPTPTAADLTGPLTQLSEATGGALNVVSVPAQYSAAARQIVTELRQQYFIAFEPSAQPGWHPLELRTKQKDLVVRARTGYMAGANQTGRVEEELSCVMSSWQ